MMKFLPACLLFCVSAYFGTFEVITKDEMCEKLIPKQSPAQLKNPFTVFYTDVSSCSPYVFMIKKQSNSWGTSKYLNALYDQSGYFTEVKGKGSMVGTSTYPQLIYITDLKYKGNDDLDLKSNPPKMILEFQISKRLAAAIILSGIYLSNDLKIEDIPGILGTISSQISDLCTQKFTNNPDQTKFTCKDLIKNVWTAITAEIRAYRLAHENELTNKLLEAVQSKAK